MEKSVDRTAIGASKQGLGKDSARLAICTVSKPIEILREPNVPLCLTFIDLKNVFDSVETEVVVEALTTETSLLNT
ncbi:hypothetical protein RB195_018174 [Necator americanus]|uniref:Reverse transcriptase domain-containing protein n=1 Tax=Necator americanus TaxID=51031 RepID=A0ABR1C8I8_NECAM